MKIIIVMSIFISLTINTLQKDEIIIEGKAVQRVRISIEQMPLIADEPDTVFASSLLLSVVAMGGSAIYGLFTHPFPFNEHDCEGKYRNQIFEQCKKTNFPCNLEKDGWIDCIESLIDTFCDADRTEYNGQLPDKKVAAWAPLMVVATASVAFNGSWLLGKWIGRKINSRTAFESQNSIALEMEPI